MTSSSSSSFPPHATTIARPSTTTTYNNNQNGAVRRSITSGSNPPADTAAATTTATRPHTNHSNTRMMTNSSTTTATTTNRSSKSVINSNSVQSQFQTLASHKTTLQQQIRQADADRLVETQTIARIRQAQQNLMERIRIASSHNGVEEKKRETLKNEVKRLQETLKDDQKELKELSLEVEQLKKKEMESKYHFVKEMEGINDEMADALRRCDECNLEHMLTLNSCHVVEEYLVQKILEQGEEQQQEGTSSSSPSSSSSPPPPSSSCTSGALLWKQQLDQMRALMKRFQDCHEKCTREKETHSLLIQTASDLRKKVKEKNYDALGEEELNSLEQLWENQQEDCVDSWVSSAVAAATEFDDDDDGSGGDGGVTGTSSASNSRMTGQARMADMVLGERVDNKDHDVHMQQEEEEEEEDHSGEDHQDPQNPGSLIRRSKVITNTDTSATSTMERPQELPVSMHLFYGQQG